MQGISNVLLKVIKLYSFYFIQYNILTFGTGWNNGAIKTSNKSIPIPTSSDTNYI